jgi:hypothetical protein
MSRATPLAPAGPAKNSNTATARRHKRQKQKFFGSFFQKRTLLLFLKKKKQKDFYFLVLATTVFPGGHQRWREVRRPGIAGVGGRRGQRRPLL